MLILILLATGLATCGCYYEGGIIHVEPRDSDSRTSPPGIGVNAPGASPVSTAIDTEEKSTAADTAQTDNGTDSGSDTDSNAAEPDSETVIHTDSETGTEADSDTYTDNHTDTGPDANQTETGWTFFSFADMQDNHDNGINHIRSMVTLDPDAVALFEVGDFNHYGSRSGWESHHDAISKGLADAGAPPDAIRTDARSWGNFIRLLGTPGNHEFGSWSSDWYALWREFLPGQQQLGVSSDEGVYLSISYDDTMFILLDSNNPSTAQTEWLTSVLESAESDAAKWKIAFFHEPVYSCSYRAPFEAALPWVSLFEKHKVDLVINGHTHTYEQMCPMNGGKCATGDAHGVVYLTASGGGTSYQRSVDENKSMDISHGDRSESYSCTEIMVAHESYWHHFCHYTVEDCSLTVRCYDHDLWDDGELRHELVIDKCEK